MHNILKKIYVKLCNMNNFIHEYCQNINIFMEVKNKYKSWKRKSLHWMKRDESFYLCPIIERTICIKMLGLLITR